MKLSELKSTLKETLREVIQEELKDILLEAVKSNSQQPTPSTPVAQPASPEVKQSIRENYMNVLKDITLKKQAKPVKFKDGTMKVDLFTASAITQVYNKVNMDNKKKLEDMVNGTKSQFAAMSNKIMKMVGK